MAFQLAEQVLHFGEVRADEHPVGGDVGVDDGPGSGGFHLFGEIDGFHAGCLGPAFHGDLAVAGVDAHGDPLSAKFRGHRGDEIDGLCGAGADDHARHPGVECPGDGFLAAHPPAQLARDARCGGDGADGLDVLRDAGEGRVEIDDVEVVAPFIDPLFGKRGGVVGIDGFL